MKIQDGKGSGRLASVTSKNELSVASVSSPVAANVNKEGEAFLVHSGKLTATSGGVRTLLYVKNTSSTRSIFIDSAEITHNGGNTSGNKVLLVHFSAGTPAPTANSQAISATNLNTASGNLLSADILEWDGVGTGLTVASTGLDIYHAYQGAGTFKTTAESGLILAPGSVVSVSVEVLETTDIYINAFCHTYKAE